MRVSFTRQEDGGTREHTGEGLGCHLQDKGRKGRGNIQVRVRVSITGQGEGGMREHVGEG
jgi:hypothetical protein